MKKIIVCPDSFKGCLSATKVTQVISTSLHTLFPESQIISIPLADGGEGSVEILKKFFPLRIPTTIKNPLLNAQIRSSFHSDSSYNHIFIETAEAIGLPLISAKLRNPCKTSSFGLGQLLNEALKYKPTKITISLGGSATNDGGMGMMDALGFSFVDKKEKKILPIGENLLRINNIIPPSPTQLNKILSVKLEILCDVANPLLGSQGATHIFGPQKGAKPIDIHILEEGMENFVEKLSRNGLITSKANLIPGSGAAGGLGFSLMAVFHAQHYSGIDYILKTLEFEKKIQDAALVITGEGKIDCQSLMGKVLSGVLKYSNKSNIPIIAVAGKVEDHKLLIENGLKKCVEISDPNLSYEQNMNPKYAVKNLEKAINQLYETIISHL